MTSYNRDRVIAGDITEADLETLVREFQSQHIRVGTTTGLSVDGQCGPKTLAFLRASFIYPSAILACWPLRTLADGRKPVVTSGFHTRNPSRPTHNGVDILYAYLDSDPEVESRAIPEGRRAIVSGGKRRWWMPVGAQAVAVGAGTVLDVRPDHKTGGLVWLGLDGQAWRAGYMHLDEVFVSKGQIVGPGDPIGLVGDNPQGTDVAHLHFEVSPISKYAPADPEPCLRSADVL